jgi:hypothetical protein
MKIIKKLKEFFLYLKEKLKRDKNKNKNINIDNKNNTSIDKKNKNKKNKKNISVLLLFFISKMFKKLNFVLKDILNLLFSIDIGFIFLFLSSFLLDSYIKISENIMIRLLSFIGLYFLYKILLKDLLNFIIQIKKKEK